MDMVAAIFKRQIKDTCKNKTIFIQFVMFPVLTLIMNKAVKIDGMPDNFFVNLFATMYVGMAPLTSMAAVIAEEKEKNTLRVLRMSNVKPQEYLLGIGSSIWLVCMLGAAVICAAGSYGLREELAFMAIMAVGNFASLLLGAAIGIWSKTQMMATSITVPVMMVFAFLPMLSMFNATIAKMGKITYSVQIGSMLERIDTLHLGPDNMGIVAANVVVFTALFLIAYRKCGLE